MLGGYHALHYDGESESVARYDTLQRERTDATSIWSPLYWTWLTVLRLVGIWAYWSQADGREKTPCVAMLNANQSF
jgi:hypothetical protein